jgi:hypothetical protein
MLRVWWPERSIAPSGAAPATIRELAKNSRGEIVAAARAVNEGQGRRLLGAQVGRRRRETEVP